jgi:DNA-binding CsgD family transcriptional regulator
LFEAIEQVTRALPYCDPKITQLVKQAPTNTSMPNCNLTDREIEVLIRLDLRNKEISEELDMKLRTVEKHIECILAKLKVPTRTAAALKAVQLGYVLLPKMPGRDPVTGVTHEQTVAELQAELAIANEHLKALLNQNQLLKDALNEKMRGASSQNSAAQSNPAPAPPAAQASPPVNPAPPPQRSSTSPAADD